MKGIIAELDELIALKRFASKQRFYEKASTFTNGNYLSPIRGRGMDFSEVRHYQMGDDLRHMDWRVTARTGKPHIKVYQEEKERPVILVTDFSPSMYFGTRVAFKSNVAARLAAIIAWMSIKQGDKVGAFLFSKDKHNEFIPKARESHILPLLSCLSGYTKDFSKDSYSKNTTNLADELLRLRRVAKPGSFIIIISDFYQLNAEGEKQLLRLRAQNDLLFYHIADFLELEPPKPGYFGFSSGQQELLLNTHNAKLIKNYQTWCETTGNSIRSYCKKLNIPYVLIRAEHDLAKILKQTLPKRSLYG